MAQVETVTGPVDAAELGTTLIHEHLLARDEGLTFQFPQMGTTAGDPIRAVSTDGAEEVARECAAGIVERGVRTICDPSAMFLGRDVGLMRRVSEATGLQVVPCTGIYTYDHLPTGLLTRDADAIADLFVHDIEQGIQGTEIKAAFIKCAADEPGITENVEKVHRAAARASVRTGAPIMAHSRPLSDTAPRQIDIFEEEGADLSRVQIAHCGDSADPDYIESLLDRGVYAGLDRFGLEMYLPFDQRIATASALLERGRAERLFISADYCATIDWFSPETEQAMLDAGMAVDWSMNIVHDKVLPALREGGMTAEQERTMLVENPVRWLTGAPA
jgi:phosphotriesterase-related protein